MFHDCFFNSCNEMLKLELCMISEGMNFMSSIEKPLLIVRHKQRWQMVFWSRFLSILCDSKGREWFLSHYRWCLLPVAVCQSLYVEYTFSFHLKQNRRFESLCLKNSQANSEAIISYFTINNFFACVLFFGGMRKRNKKSIKGERKLPPWFKMYSMLKFVLLKKDHCQVIQPSQKRYLQSFIPHIINPE